MQQAKNNSLVNNGEEVKEPTLNRAPASLAGNLNSNQGDKVHGTQVGILPEAECLTFRKHIGGDTLDAFAPLAQYTQRVHHGQMESTWMKVSNTITLPDGTVIQRTSVREEDYIPEAASLLTARVKNPLMRREQFATDQRKSRKKGIIQSKRELYSCKTPVERSVSPMFGGRSEVSNENEKSGDGDSVLLEEVKQIVYDSPALTDVPNGSDIRDVQ